MPDDAAPERASPGGLAPERYARINGTLLGARGNEWVTLRASDVRACFGLADRVEEALQVVGENDALRKRIAMLTAEAARVQPLLERIAALENLAREAARAPILSDLLMASEAKVGALQNRINLAGKMLRGDA